MPRCGCGSISLPGCGCALQSGNGVNVTGIGSANAPYQASANLDVAANNILQNGSQGLYVSAARGLIGRFEQTAYTLQDRGVAIGTETQIAIMSFTVVGTRAIAIHFMQPCIASSYAPGGSTNDTAYSLVRLKLKIDGYQYSGAIVELNHIVTNAGVPGVTPHGIPVNIYYRLNVGGGTHSVQVTMQRDEGTASLWAFSEGGFPQQLDVYDMGPAV